MWSAHPYFFGCLILNRTYALELLTMMFASLITKLVSIGPTWYDVPVHQQVRLVDVAVFHKTEENVHATAAATPHRRWLGSRCYRGWMAAVPVRIEGYSIDWLVVVVVVVVYVCVAVLIPSVPLAWLHVCCCLRTESLGCWSDFWLVFQYIRVRPLVLDCPGSGSQRLSSWYCC